MKKRMIIIVAIVMGIWSPWLVAQETPQTSSGCPLTTDHGATVTREPNGITITGISPSVATVDTKNVTGFADGTLRIRWASRDHDRDYDHDRDDDHERDRSPVSPPGAPEIPAPWMFGSGFLILGFGLLRYRRIA